MISRPEEEFELEFKQLLSELYEKINTMQDNMQESLNTDDLADLMSMMSTQVNSAQSIRELNFYKEKLYLLAQSSLQSKDVYTSLIANIATHQLFKNHPNIQLISSQLNEMIDNNAQCFLLPSSGNYEQENEVHMQELIWQALDVSIAQEEPLDITSLLTRFDIRAEERARQASNGDDMEEEVVYSKRPGFE